MLTCKSPRKVMRVAFHLARGVLPRYSSRFSRHDFTLPQLFACLVLKEHQRQSYRQVEALLHDAPQWCRDIGMSKAAGITPRSTNARPMHGEALRPGEAPSSPWASARARI